MQGCPDVHMRSKTDCVHASQLSREPTQQRSTDNKSEARSNRGRARSVCCTAHLQSLYQLRVAACHQLAEDLCMRRGNDPRWAGVTSGSCPRRTLGGGSANFGGPLEGGSCRDCCCHQISDKHDWASVEGRQARSAPHAIMLEPRASSSVGTQRQIRCEQSQNAR